MAGHHPDEFNPDSQDDAGRIQGFVRDTYAAISDLFRDPPAGMAGRYFDDQRNAWEMFSSQWLRTMLSRTQSIPPGILAEAGLISEAGKAKFRLWADARQEFLRLRNSRRASRMCHIGVSILGSLAGPLNLSEPFKEALEGIKYLADLAIQEGSA